MSLETSLLLAEVLAAFATTYGTEEATSRRLENLLRLSDTCGGFHKNGIPEHFVGALHFTRLTGGLFALYIFDIVLPSFEKVVVTAYPSIDDPDVKTAALRFVSSFTEELSQLSLVLPIVLLRPIVTMYTSLTPARNEVSLVLLTGFLTLTRHVLDENSTALPADIIGTLETALLRGFEASVISPSVVTPVITAVRGYLCLPTPGPKSLAISEHVAGILRRYISVARIVHAVQSTDKEESVSACLLTSPALLSYALASHNKRLIHDIEHLLHSNAKFLTKPIGVLQDASTSKTFTSSTMEVIGVAYLQCLRNASKAVQDHRFLASLQEAVFSPASLLYQINDDENLVDKLRHEGMLCLCGVLCDHTLTTTHQVNDYVSELISRLRHMANVGGTWSYIVSLIDCAEKVVTNYNGERWVVFKNVHIELSDSISRYGIPPNVQDLCITSLCRLTATCSEELKQYLTCVDLVCDHYINLVRTTAEEGWRESDSKYVTRLGGVASMFHCLLVQEGRKDIQDYHSYLRNAVLQLFPRIAWPQTGTAYYKKGSMELAKNSIRPLLQPLGAVMRAYSEEGSAFYQKLFREMWLLCVIHELVSLPEAPSHVPSILSDIVAKAPMLLSLHSTIEIMNTFSEVDGLETQYRDLTSGGDSKVHEMLQRAVPSMHALALKLTVGEAMLLLGLYTLEYRRAHQGDIASLLYYTNLECSELQTRVDFREAIIHVCRGAIARLLEYLRQLPRSEVQDRLRAQICLIFLSSCHSVHAVRMEALYYLELILNEFPSIFLGHIGTLLSLSYIMRCGKYEDLVALANASAASVQFLPFTPASEGERLRVADSLKALRNDWVRRLALTCTTLTVEELVCWLQQHPDEADDLIELVVSLTLIPNELRTRSVLLSASHGVHSNSPITAELMRRASATAPGYQHASFLTKQWRNNKEGNATQCDAALRELVDSRSVPCWRWVCSAVPDVSHPLLSRVVTFWSRTMERREGLFGAHGVVCSDHEAIIAFLYDYYIDENTVLATHAVTLELISRLIYVTVADLTKLNVSPASHLCYMRFGLLSLCFCSTLFRSNATAAQALRLRVFHFLLHWLSHPPQWFPMASDILTCHKTTALLVEIVGNLTQPEEEDAEKASEPTSSSRRGSTNSSTPTTPLVPRMTKIAALICVLLRNEVDRYCVWLRPRAPATCLHPLRATSPFLVDDVTRLDSVDIWRSLINTCLYSCPAVALQLPVRFPFPMIRAEVESLVQRSPMPFCRLPAAVPYYITEANISRIQPGSLFEWAPCAPHVALQFLTRGFRTKDSKQVASTYALQSLSVCSVPTMIHVLPQLIQALRHDGTTGQVEQFFVRRAKESIHLCHQVLWALRTEMGIPNTTNSDLPPSDTSPSSAMFSSTCARLHTTILSSLDASQRQAFHMEFQFFHALVDISGTLKTVEKSERKESLVEALRTIQIPSEAYLPTDPTCLVKEVLYSGATSLQSAAKCPILVPFKVSTGNGAATTTKCLILKKGDDCRQDQLALQIIGMFKKVYEQAQIPSYLCPYRVVTTGPLCGIIECVEDCISRDQLGKNSEGNLYEYFQQKYGSESSPAFRRAREHFVQSMASYSVVSHILNVKDRHNGNILLHGKGHVIHIDFGFILDYSPGGDINFESSPFKLTAEMLEVMTRSTTMDSTGYSMLYALFVEYVIRCFLSVRDHMNEIVPFVELMLDSGLPCFKPTKTMKDLGERFGCGKTVREAALYMNQCVEQSHKNVYTNLYDRFQYMAEGIEM